MRPKAQHYVPQFYLRNFAQERKSNFYINCFNKVSKQYYKTNVKNIAHENYFYDFENQNGEMMSIESSLSDIESKAKFAIHDIIENASVNRLQKYKETLSCFIYVQEMRTLDFRDRHNELISLANTQLCEKFQVQNPLFKNPTENDTKMFQAYYLSETVREMADVIRNMKWGLIINQTKVPFWTSDNPVFRYNSSIQKYKGNLGFFSEGIEIYFPISPSLMILLCDPVKYAGIPPVIGGKYKDVKFQNTLQVINSRKYLYSSEDDFSLAEELIRNDPELSNPKRSRAKVA